MGIKLVDVAIPLVLNLVHFASCKHFLPCNGSTLFICGESETCDTKKELCMCISDYVLVGDECQPATESSHVVTSVVATLVALVLIGGALVLVVRRYNIVEYVRRKINLRNNNDIVYEDVMIGQDVPPLTP